MASTEVLLVKPVEGLGGEGDQVKVRAGFARNFLLPRKIAVPLTVANRKQVEALKKGVEVVVGTPGRLIDLAQQGHLDLGHARIVVLDEDVPF